MMRIARATLVAILGLAAAVGAASPAHAAGGSNDPSCRPTAAHPSPVVLLHGLGANGSEDIDQIQAQLTSLGYCTFSLTYGTGYYGSFVGGVNDINSSAAQIAGFIRQVLAETGAPKVDLVGHSEGAFQSLYVTKTQGISSSIDKVVAIAPPTHGTSFGGLQNIGDTLGAQFLYNTVLNTFGCLACDQLLTNGTAVNTLNNGPIAQPGVAYTVMTSKYDELVTPTSTSFVNEPGVVNEYVQDFCPNDPVGHIGEAYDSNVWNLIENALDPGNAKTFTCSAGSPG